MRKAFVLLFVLVMTSAMCQAVHFTITYPNGGEKLFLKQTVVRHRIQVGNLPWWLELKSVGRRQEYSP